MLSHCCDALREAAPSAKNTGSNKRPATVAAASAVATEDGKKKGPKVAVGDLQDNSVQQVDGRADRLRQNLMRDLQKEQQSLEQQVALDIIDAQHYIGTGEAFKKANVVSKEKIKKIKGEVAKIGYKIDRSANPKAFPEVVDLLDKFKGKLDACSRLASLPADSSMDVEDAINDAEKAGISVSISFHGMSFFQKWQSLISTERHGEGMALMEQGSACVQSMSKKLKNVPATVPAAVREHLNPEFLAACALERSFESFMLVKCKNFAKSHLAKTCHGLMVQVAGAVETNLLHGKVEPAKRIGHLLSPEKAGYAELGEALSRVIPNFHEDPQAAPFLDEEPDPLIKMLGSSCGRQVM